MTTQASTSDHQLVTETFDITEHTFFIATVYNNTVDNPTEPRYKHGLIFHTVWSPKTGILKLTKPPSQPYVPVPPDNLLDILHSNAKDFLTSRKEEIVGSANYSKTWEEEDVSWRKRVDRILWESYGYFPPQNFYLVTSAALEAVKSEIQTFLAVHKSLPSTVTITVQVPSDITSSQAAHDSVTYNSVFTDTFEFREVSKGTLTDEREQAKLIRRRYAVRHVVNDPSRVRSGLDTQRD